jgi:2-oxoglutarate dehydrogenase E1 component
MKDQTFLSAPNAAFIEDLYRRFRRAPESVASDWRHFFAQLDSQIPGSTNPASDCSPYRDAAAAARLVSAYRQWGHRIATLDPLGLAPPLAPPELDPASYGFATGDYDRSVALGGELGLERARLGELLEKLRAAYCGTLAAEFMHVGDAGPRTWLQDALESAARPAAQDRVRAAERIIEADELERFMHRRFPGRKRFGAEGAESLLALLDRVVVRSAALGAREVVMGGTSRARLNVMANILGVPLPALFSAFGGDAAFDPDQATGDVVYHLGFCAQRDFSGHPVRVSWAPNPSHLEAVDAVLMGSVRARQDAHGDAREARRRVLSILVHTDAAFAGQGIVAETFQLSGLQGYRCGGTIHLVINNQIGFTTGPREGRTSAYCSDVAKLVEAPVLHVNGDDVDAALRAGAIAAEFRHRFQRDIVVDLVCYRRRGHNELDEPSFTQPRMYRVIEDHPTVRELYLARLQSESVMARDRVASIGETYRLRLGRGFEAAGRCRSNEPPWGQHQWDGESRAARKAMLEGATGVSLRRLREAGATLARAPAHFTANPKLDRLFEGRRVMLESGERVTWAMAEGLAIGSLLCEGVPVRMSGQDAARGAFNQRHYVLFDTDVETPYVPLNHIRSGQAPLAIVDSPLAEYATLAFEYGYSVTAPETLVIWEAQFGDFANVAQVIIDQFIAGGEDKWLQPSGIVLLLPHGLEGDGPDHSSARLERFLQLCGRDNLRVCNCTTPANYFHALRGQARGPARKPLILMTPKSLLRHKDAVSTLSDLGPGSAFQPVLAHAPDAGDGEVRRVVLCAGKVAYDLEEERRAQNAPHAAIVRIEQLHPFPTHALAQALAPFRATEVLWCQEEPRNMGAWSYVDRRIEETLRSIGCTSRWPRYVGRPEGASPASGTLAAHKAEQKTLVRAALAD